MAQILNEVCSTFKTEETTRGDLQNEIDTFKLAHANWVTRIENMQNGSEKILRDRIPSHLECSLGRWYYGIGQLEFGENQEFVAVEAQHIKFHKLLAEFVDAYSEKGAEKSELVLNQLRMVSEDVENNLEQLKQTI